MMHQCVFSAESLHPMSSTCPNETEALWVMNVVQLPARVHMEISCSDCYSLLCAKPKPVRQISFNLILTKSFGLEKTS